MAEAVAAVGLASNIISFVDFAAHLLEIGSQIRKKDLKDPPSDPQLIMRSLESISSKVNNKKVATCHTEDEKILNDITDDCIAIAKDLVTDIRDITKTINKVDQAGNKPAQVAQSIAAAIKIHRGRPRMEKLSAKLDQHRHLLGTSVLVLIQNKVDAALDGIRFATYQSQEAHERTTSTLSTLINNTTGSQETLLEIKEGIQSIKDLLKSNTIYPPVPRVFTDLDPSLKSAALHGHAQVERKFLSWLHFPIMVARKKAVNPASLDTFLWIFKEDTGDKNNFASWLVRGAGIYWISGKAGCGKSTLMKLLMDRPETVSCLETWAGTDHSLVRPSCFFWAAGSDLQRCQEGLLRTLLHTILKHRPDLTAQLFPERYEAILNDIFADVHQPEIWFTCDQPGCSAAFDNYRELEAHLKESHKLSLAELHASSKGRETAFTVPELQDAFLKLKSISLGSLKIALFVDGLDEYQGDQAEMVKLFTEITSDPRIKAVVSSRPESLFEASFKHLPMMQMENLTNQDMVTYVKGKLETHTNIHLITNRNPEFLDEFSNKVASKAQGVFLWTALAVKLLLETLTAGCLISDLEKVLDKCPKELKDLYFHMFKRMGNEKRVEAFQILRCTRQAMQTEGSIPTLFRFWFWISTSTGESISASRRLIERTIFRDNLQLTANRIRDRLYGLLEAKWDGLKDDYCEGEVYPFHRTLVEFLEEPTILEVMEKETMEFSAGEHILGSILWCLKSKWYYRLKNAQDWKNLKIELGNAIKYMRDLGDENSLQMKYLDAFDCVMQDLWKEKAAGTRTKAFADYHQHWSQELLGAIGKPSEHHPLVHLALHHKLYQVVKMKIDTELRQWNDGWEVIFKTILLSELYYSGHHGHLMEPIQRVANFSTQFTTASAHAPSKLSPWEVLLYLQPLTTGHTPITTRAGSDHKDKIIAFGRWVEFVKLFVESGWSLDYSCKSKENAPRTQAHWLIQRAIDSARNIRGLPGTELEQLQSAVEVLLQSISENSSTREQKEKRKKKEKKKKEKATTTEEETSTSEARPSGKEPSRAVTSYMCNAMRALAPLGFTAAEVIDAIDNSGVSPHAESMASWIITKQQKGKSKERIEDKLALTPKSVEIKTTTEPWADVASLNYRGKKKGESPVRFPGNQQLSGNASSSGHTQQRRTGIIEAGKRRMTWSMQSGRFLSKEEENLIQDILWQ